jgi:hypothetical protein
LNLPAENNRSFSFAPPDSRRDNAGVTFIAASTVVQGRCHMPVTVDRLQAEATLALGNFCDGCFLLAQGVLAQYLGRVRAETFHHAAEAGRIAIHCTCSF